MTVDPAQVEAAARAYAASELLRQRLQQTVIVPVPAAGAEWQQAVPDGKTWELLAVTQRLATSATVANRTSSVIVTDPDNNIVARWAPAAAQGAGLTLTYTWGAGLGFAINQGPLNSGLPSPPQVIPSGYRLTSFTGALDPADQYLGILLTVRQWSMVDCSSAAEWLADHWRR